MKNWKDVLAVPLSPHDVYYPDDPRLAGVAFADWFEKWFMTPRYERVEPVLIPQSPEFKQSQENLDAMVRSSFGLPKEMLRLPGQIKSGICS